MEMMTNLHISKDSLDQWLCQMISENIRVFAPVLQGHNVDFRLLSSGIEWQRIIYRLLSR